MDAIREVVESPLYVRGKALLVSNIGFCSRELYSIHDSPRNFYMLGSMGLASSIGLGLALARKKREVVVLDGDGSVLMNLGGLSTIANFAPKNFHLFILDDHVHSSTGGQKSHTAMRTDLLKVSRGAGVRRSTRVRGRLRLRNLLRRKTLLPTVIVVDCEPSDCVAPIIPISEKKIKQRFVKAASQ